MSKASLSAEAQIIPWPIKEKSAPSLSKEELSEVVDTIRQLSLKIDELEEELCLVKQANNEQDQQCKYQLLGSKKRSPHQFSNKASIDTNDPASPLFHSQTIFFITGEIMQLKKERDRLLIRLPSEEHDSLVEQLEAVSEIRQKTGLSISSDELPENSFLVDQKRVGHLKIQIEQREKEKKRTQVTADLVSDLKHLARKINKVVRNEIYRGPDYRQEHVVPIFEVLVKEDDLKARFFTTSEQGYQPPNKPQLRLVVLNGAHYITLEELDFDTLVKLRAAVGNKLKKINGETKEG